MTSLSLAPKVYKGKFSYKDNAKDENIYVSLAAGLVDKGPAHIFSTWTKSYRGYVKAPLVSIGHIAFDETDTDSFIVFDGYYTWKGKVLGGGDKIVLGIWYGDEKEARSETTIEVVNSAGPSSGN